MDARRHDLDALRGFAMLLGIALHASLAYLESGGEWPVVDSETSPMLEKLVVFVHGFRMPLFFVLSGFFTAMLWRKWGLRGLLRHRVKRILLPLGVGCLTIVPAVWIVIFAQSRANPTYGVPESNQNLWTAAAHGDLDQVKRFVDRGWPLDEADPFYNQTPLAWAVIHDRLQVADYLLAQGADALSQFGRRLETHLHVAAFFGRFELARLLVAAGADVNVRNRTGETPMDAMRHGEETVQAIARALLVGVDFDEVVAGRECIADLLRSAGAVSGRASTPQPVRSAGEWTEAEASRDFMMRAALAGLMYFPFFHHLWFLWLLFWLIVGFALVAVAFPAILAKLRPPWWLVSSPVALLWLVPLTAYAQLSMFAGIVVPGFGPDTSAGLLPIPHVVAYYAIFFGFGALVFLTPGAADRLGVGWWALLPGALAVFPMALFLAVMTDWGYDLAGDELTRRSLSALGQSLFCWLMVLGAVGLCKRLLSGERRWVRYLSDSSYWLYLAHLPLVLVGQGLLQPLPISGIAKFSLLMVASTAILLASYEWGVRYTFVGRGLNGPRKRPTR